MVLVLSVVHAFLSTVLYRAVICGGQAPFPCSFFTLLQAQPHWLSDLGWLVSHVGSLAEVGFRFGAGLGVAFFFLRLEAL